MIENVRFNKRYTGSKQIIVPFKKGLREGVYDVILIPKPFKLLKNTQGGSK